MSNLPPVAMRRLPLGPSSLAALVKVSRESVSNSVSSVLDFVNMRY